MEIPYPKTSETQTELIVDVSFFEKNPKQTLCLKCYTNVQTISTSHTLEVMCDIGESREGRMQKEQRRRRTGVEEGGGEEKWENEREGGFYKNAAERC